MASEERITSRRAILAASAGGVAALVTSALARPLGVARAATSDPVLAGTANTADASTILAISGAVDGTDVSGFEAAGFTNGPGLVGASPRGNGVLGVSGTTSTGGEWGTDAGVFGRADHPEAIAGVAGDSGAIGVLGTANTIGVVGDAQGVGILAHSFDNTGTALYAAQGTLPLPAPLANTALHAHRPSVGSGYAAYIDGRLKLRLSGRVSVASGATSKAVTVSGVTTSSIVLALFQTSEPGSYVRAVVPATGASRIYFNRALLSSAIVGWMVIG